MPSWVLVLPTESTRKLVDQELRRLTLHQVRTRCFTDEQLAGAWLGEAEEDMGGKSADGPRVSDNLSVPGEKAAPGARTIGKYPVSLGGVNLVGFRIAWRS